MKEIAEQLKNIAEEYAGELKKVREETYSFKPNANKWSKKEILGHLIDSAQNNIRRFVVGQYEEAPRIIYKQDDWVAIADYQNYSTKDLIGFWRLINNHASIILSRISPEMAQRKCDTNDTVLHTIEWLAADYIKHLLHHLHQILDLEPVAYP
jgi:hypothetical protein